MKKNIVKRIFFSKIDDSIIYILRLGVNGGAKKRSGGYGFKKVYWYVTTGECPRTYRPITRHKLLSRYKSARP